MRSRYLLAAVAVVVLAAFRPAAGAPVQIEFKEAAVLPTGEMRLRQVAQLSGGEPPKLAGDMANISLGPAPLAGNARSVTKEQVEVCLMRAGFDIAQLRWRGAPSCTVTVQTARITAEQIVQAAKDQLTSLPMLRKRDVRIEVEEMPRDYIVADGGIPLTLSAFAASADQPWGRLRVFVKVLEQDKTLVTVPVMFLVTCKQKALALVKSLNRGETIERSDLETREVLLGPASVPEAYLADIESVIGKTTVRATPAGTLLTAPMIAEPFAVRQGEDVALSLKSSHLEVATRGVAQKDGCIGEMIPVKVFVSGKSLNCKVAGIGIVEVPL